MYSDYLSRAGWPKTTRSVRNRSLEKALTSSQKFYTDPMVTSSLDQDLTIGIFSLLLESRDSPRLPAPLPRREPLGLERLPAELLDRIRDFLPTQSSIVLHRTSRTLALKTPLDSHFWYQSISTGKLLPYLWGVDWAEFLRGLTTSRILYRSQNPFQPGIGDNLGNCYQIPLH